MRILILLPILLLAGCSDESRVSLPPSQMEIEACDALEAKARESKSPADVKAYRAACEDLAWAYAHPAGRPKKGVKWAHPQSRHGCLGCLELGGCLFPLFCRGRLLGGPEDQKQSQAYLNRALEATKWESP